jgi:cytoskeletal protein RodZ
MKMAEPKKKKKLLTKRGKKTTITALVILCVLDLVLVWSVYTYRYNKLIEKTSELALKRSGGNSS